MRGLDGDGSDDGRLRAHPQGVPKEKTGTGVFFGGRGMPVRQAKKLRRAPLRHRLAPAVTFTVDQGRAWAREHSAPSKTKER